MARQSYGQYCPLALAVELLCRRWTMLIVSRLIDGCRSFNEIHRGVPKISPSLLSQRLLELEDAGLVRRSKQKKGKRAVYEPTRACMDLEDIVMDLSIWGQHWARDMRLEDLDPGFLAWSMSLRMDTEKMPDARTVVFFEFTGAPTDFRCFWLVSDAGKVDMCLKDPGHEVDVSVRADLLTFVECWRGFRDLRQEIGAGRIVLRGSREACRAFPDWLKLSMLAPYGRKSAGREKRLASVTGQPNRGSASQRI